MSDKAQLPKCLKVQVPSKEGALILNAPENFATRRELSESAMALRTPVSILAKKVDAALATFSKTDKQTKAVAKAMKLDLGALADLSTDLRAVLDQHATPEDEEETPDVPR